MGSQEKNEGKIKLDLGSLAAKITDRATKTKSLFSEARIYRLPEDLRQVKESAYTPRLIAIGPLHHGKEGLKKPMDDVKFYYTYNLLDRLAEGTRDEKLEECATKMGECVKTAKKYYAEEVEFKDQEMAEMMLFDGFFILGLLYDSYKIKKETEKCTTKGGNCGNSKASSSIVLQPTDEGADGSRESRDPILDNILIASIVKHDLLLFENQIPFFVLEDLFNLTVAKIPDDKIPGGKKLSLEQYVVSYFGDIMSPEGENSVSEKKTSCCCCPSDYVLWVCGGSTKANELKKKKPRKANHKYDHILDLLHDHYRPGDQGENKPNSAKDPCPWPLTTARPRGTPPKKFSALEVRASELDHGGVKFVPAEGNNLFGVKFREPKGIWWWLHRATFEIPTVVINDSMETFLRNLIAYEQFCGISPELRYITSYAKLMDVLINSEKDVEVLSKANVIRNFSGTDEDVSKLLNKLCKEVVAGFFFEAACQKAFEYSKRCWPRYMAYWRRTYFAAPWAFKGVCLALILFLIQVANFVRISLHKRF